jgi:putative heme-binding domain-containing protein
MLRYLIAVCSLACCGVLLSDEADDALRARDAQVVATLLRLPGFDLNSKPAAKAAALRHVATLAGTEEYVSIVEQLNLTDAAPGLLKQALAAPDATLGVRSVQLLFKFQATASLEAAVLSDDEAVALPAITATGLAQQEGALKWFLQVVDHPERSVAARVAAVQALGRLARGEDELLRRAMAESVPADLQFAVANVLLASARDEIRTKAAKHVRPPATADATPLPPLTELVARSGEPSRGQQLFSTKGTCAKCHVVQGQGKEVGPNLTEIGSKLSREALYVSILDPSAGVSHNYETSLFALHNGQIITGIVTSDTAEHVVVKTADAISLTLPKSEIEESRKLKTSLMPANLQALLTTEELVDLVAYLTTLKKP